MASAPSRACSSSGPGATATRWLVASADGVGTKLLVAAALGRYESVGRDLVNHCVNDILTAGAEPLFFLDYLATSGLSQERRLEVVAGVGAACEENGVALLGGETADMPTSTRPATTTSPASSSASPSARRSSTARRSRRATC